MTSQIDPTKPGEGLAYTADVRSNFNHAKGEISSLQYRVSNLEQQGGGSDLEARVAALEATVTLLKSRQMAAGAALTVDPPNTSSNDFVTAGIGVQFTTTWGTRGIFRLQGMLGNTQNNHISELQLCYGTGSSPVFGTLVSNTNGQLIGGVVGMMSARSNDFTPFGVEVLLSSLVPGSPYWLGVGFRTDVGGVATLTQSSIVVFEVLDPLP